MNSKIYRIVGIAALAGTMLGLQACWGGGHGYDPYGYGGQSYGYSGSSYGYAPSYAYASPPVVYRDYDEHRVVRDRDDRVNVNHEQVESRRQERAEPRDSDHDNDRR